MSFVLDASIAAAWFLSDEQHDAADRLMSEIRLTVALVPTLFWFETRNLFLVAEQRGRLRPGEPLLLMTQLRGLPLEDAGSGGDGLVLELAARHALTAYDASYVALARTQGSPLATGDRKMAAAARVEGVTRSEMNTELPLSGNEILKRADALDAILPFDRRDQLAHLLTDDDLATLKHLASEGMGDNTMRALTSDLAYLETWCSVATDTPLPGRHPRAYS